MTIYQENGYANRREYLKSVAEDFGITFREVANIASTLGPDEDFDALISVVEDYAIMKECCEYE